MTQATTLSEEWVHHILEERLNALLPIEHAAPQVLHRAMRYAVFSGGKRIRPRLLFAVADACSPESMTATTRQIALAAACAVEYIHCASLVHDDLPCFDNAATRRGCPTVHMAFGEPLAVLVGDALLTRAFEVLTETPAKYASRVLRIIKLLGRLTGSVEGIIGGQSLEDEHQTDVMLMTASGVARYHAMKTAALFRFAAEAGAIAAGARNPTAWGELGVGLGLAYQLADDLYDAYAEASATAPKPVGRDAALGRPNATRLQGLAESVASLSRQAVRLQQQALSLGAKPGLLTDLFGEIPRHVSLMVSEGSQPLAATPAH